MVDAIFRAVLLALEIDSFIPFRSAESCIFYSIPWYATSRIFHCTLVSIRSLA